MDLRITTWNVNSIRLRLDLVARLLARVPVDVLCLQETKVHDDAFPRAALADLGFAHLHCRGNKGHHGVAIASRLPLAAPATLTWCGQDDGRHVAATVAGIEIHNFYVPAGGDVPDPDANPKFAHKLDFLAEMTAWTAALPPAPRLLVGDLNIAPLETDVWSHRQLLKVVSHTPVEVDALNRLQAAGGWVDAVRHIHAPEHKLFTWWSYRSRQWQVSNRGRRLDHVWCSPDLVPRIHDAQALTEARGWDSPSDHVPVTVTLRGTQPLR